jgi:hypothetical protein
VRVELLYFDGCPGWREMAAHLDALTVELDVTWTRVQVASPEAAEQHRFHGSPSLHIDGVDPFAPPDAAVGLSCRCYRTPLGPAGIPDRQTLRTVLLAAGAGPRTR